MNSFILWTARDFPLRMHGSSFRQVYMLGSKNGLTLYCRKEAAAGGPIVVFLTM